VPELPPARGSAWHLGVLVDVRDVAAAFAAALACPDPGHVRLLLCAEEIASDRPTAQVVADYLPDVPWRDAAPAAGSRTALADSSAARAVLGWRTRYEWRGRGTPESTN
jgi:UDP-glucose 4-epimerase